VVLGLLIHEVSTVDHTQLRITVGRTPPDELSVRRRDLYLTKKNAHNRQTSMLRVGFEPTISAGERPQAYALDRPATGIGISVTNVSKSVVITKLTVSGCMSEAVLSLSTPAIRGGAIPSHDHATFCSVFRVVLVLYVLFKYAKVGKKVTSSIFSHKL